MTHCWQSGIPSGAPLELPATRAAARLVRLSMKPTLHTQLSTLAAPLLEAFTPFSLRVVVRFRGVQSRHPAMLSCPGSGLYVPDWQP
jgi:hypothetical protein